MKKIILMITIFFVSLLSMNVYANSHSYIMMDIETKRILKGSNYHNKSLVASTAKILTCIIGLENGPLFDLVKVDKSDTLMEGSKIYIEENDEILYMDVLYGLMLRSGNDAANLIARTTFSTYEEFILCMNETSKKIGMKNSTFANPSGLDSLEFNLSTAYDMAILTAYAMQNEHFRVITRTKLYVSQTINNNIYHWYNKHKLVTSDKMFIGGKTGYTKKSGRILVSVCEVNGHEVVIVTINDPNDWKTHKYLANSVKNYKNYKVIESGIYDPEIKDFEYFIQVEKDYTILLTKKEVSKLYVKFKIVNLDCQMIMYLDDEAIMYEDVKLIKKTKDSS